MNATAARLRIPSVLALAAGVLLASCSSSGSTASDATVATNCAPVPVVAAPTAPLPATTALGKVTVHGTPLTSTPDNGKADPEKGCAVPIIDGQGFDGAPVRIGGPTDKPTVVVGAAHWCPHCNNELPKLVKLVADGGVADQVNWVVVSTGVQKGSPNYPPGPWLADDMGWTGTAMADDAQSNAGQALGVAGFPTFVLIDAQGKVVERIGGEIPTDQLAKKLDALVAASKASGTAGTSTTSSEPTTSAGANS